MYGVHQNVVWISGLLWLNVRQGCCMDDPTLLSWIERGQNWAALLVAIGVAAEFLLGFMAGPARRRVDQAKDAEILRLTNETGELHKQAEALRKEAEDERIARTQLAASISWRTPDPALATQLAPSLKRFAGNESLLVRKTQIRSGFLCSVGFPC